jgi:hypothetical protein
MIYFNIVMSPMQGLHKEVFHSNFVCTFVFPMLATCLTHINDLDLIPLVTLGKSWDSAVGIATCYGLDNRGVKVGVPVEGQEFSLLHIVQTGFRTHPASYPMGTRVSFSPGVKRPEREGEHSPPTSAEIKKTWVYTSTAPYIFMV